MLEIFAQFFSIIGWVFVTYWQYIVPIALLIFAYVLHLDYKQGMFIQSWDPVCLAVSVPEQNLRTPFAMEQFFATMYGIRDDRDIIERNWLGEFQESFSCEIVGINGRVHFIIRLPKKIRDHTEAAIYAQYPEAEITEVEDYTKDLPVDIATPDSGYEIWGADVELTKLDAYPIRTYVDFEKMTSGQAPEAAVDPISILVEALSTTREGEQAWFQIVAGPAQDDWVDEGKALVAKLIGKKEEKKSGFLDSFLGGFLAEMIEWIWKGIAEAPFKPPEFEYPKKGGDDDDNRWPTLMQHLSPGERNVIEAIEGNISKKGFYCKMRVAVVFKTDENGKYEKQRFKEFRAKFNGFLSQFTSVDLNDFIYKRKVSAHYWFPETRKNYRRNQILSEYKKRKITAGKQMFLNTEELATLFHFPQITVKAPKVQWVESRKGKPPAGLPT